MKMIALAAAAALSLAGAPAVAVTVQNGSFESLAGGVMTHNGGSWQVYSSIPGWTTVSGRGIEVQSNATLGSIDAVDGTRYVELDSHPRRGSNSTMQQMVDLVAGTYQLEFYYSPRTNRTNSNGIDYAVGSLLSGSISGPGGGTSVGQWTLVSERFTVVTAGSYALQFGAFGREDTLGGLIDDVSIAPVPLPAALGFLLAGLGALGLVRARRSA